MLVLVNAGQCVLMLVCACPYVSVLAFAGLEIGRWLERRGVCVVRIGRRGEAVEFRGLGMGR